MADLSEAQETTETATSPTSVVPLTPVIVTILLAFCVMGGVAFWFVRSGKLQTLPVAAMVQQEQKVPPLKTKLVALDPLLVNLADEGGASYLRIAMTVRVEETSEGKPAPEKAEKGKSLDEQEIAFRDAVLNVLGRQTSETLLAADGKQHLKESLRAAMSEHVPGAKVQDVLFTDFLVQR